MHTILCTCMIILQKFQIEGVLAFWFFRDTLYDHWLAPKYLKKYVNGINLFCGEKSKRHYHSAFKELHKDIIHAL